MFKGNSNVAIKEFATIIGEQLSQRFHRRLSEELLLLGQVEIVHEHQVQEARTRTVHSLATTLRSHVNDVLVSNNSNINNSMRERREAAREA